LKNSYTALQNKIGGAGNIDDKNILSIPANGTQDKKTLGYNFLYSQKKGAPYKWCFLIIGRVILKFKL
jgi:hypothetical protein